jgi:hypothetical protein
MSNNFIYNPNIQLSKKIESTDCFYGIISDYDFVDTDNNPRINKEIDTRVLAKIKYRDNGNKKYLIKIDNNKKLFNPSSPLSENKKNYLLDQYEADKSNFKEVSERVFSNYLKFLKTSNPSWILNAEREDF